MALSVHGNQQNVTHVLGYEPKSGLRGTSSLGLSSEQAVVLWINRMIWCLINFSDEKSMTVLHILVPSNSHGEGTKKVQKFR